MYTCPICYFDGMTEPPQDYNICECCGTEFGNDDDNRSHEELRTEWLRSGAPWFFGEPPIGWNPWRQTQVIAISPLRNPSYKVTFAGTPKIYRMVASTGTPARQADETETGSYEVFAGTSQDFYAFPSSSKEIPCPS